jgi:UDPglucose 6-dehydrogenase
VVFVNFVIVTEWKNFWSPDFDVLKTKLKDAVIFDGRNLYQPEVLEEKGIAYYAIGRGRSA